MAGITHLTEFQKPALKGFVDESIKNQVPSVIDKYIGNETTYDTKFAYDIVKRSNHIAAMIGLGAEKPVVDRHATASVMGELAHFGLKDVVTIEELYAIAQARNNNEKSAMVDKLVNKAGDLVDWLQLRVKVEKLKAAAIGVNEYNKNGVKVSLDYGITQKFALSSGADWDVADRDVIGDLLEWDEVYRSENGKGADAILMTRQTLMKLTKNSLIVAEAGRPEGVLRVSEAELNSVLSGFGLPAIEIIVDTSVEVKDVYTGELETIDVFPVNRIIFISAGAGVFLTGPNPDADNFAPVATLEAYDLRTPKRSVIEVAQSGFAILENPNLVLHADVYTV